MGIRKKLQGKGHIEETPCATDGAMDPLIYWQASYFCFHIWPILISTKYYLNMLLSLDLACNILNNISMFFQPRESAFLLSINVEMVGVLKRNGFVIIMQIALMEVMRNTYCVVSNKLIHESDV